MIGKEALMQKRKEIIGVIYFTVALFLALCLLSYHPNDPSFTRFVPEYQTVQNIVGTVGSYTADTLIRLVGVSAFWFSIILFVAAYRYFKDEHFRIGLIGAAGLAGIVVSTSALFAAAIGDMTVYGTRLRTGGLLGSSLLGLLDAYLNPAGAYMILIVVLIVSLMVVIDLSLVTVGRKVTDIAAKSGPASGVLFAKMKALYDKWREGGSPQEDAVEPFIDETPEIPERTRPNKKKEVPEQIPFDFFTDESPFDLPPLSLLNKIERKDTRMKRESLIANSRILEKKLLDFGVEGRVVEVRPGPVITMYELEPAPGVKINKITNLSDDLALALKAPSIRIIAPIPGKAVIGIEIPNHEREPVHLKDVLDTEAFLESPIRLPIALGEDITGNPVITDLIRMPHLLIAGTTGSGKSVGLNAMICSILFKQPPDEVKFLLIDPKRLELSAYEGIPHLLHPVVVDPKKAAQVLKWAVEEMERRYEIISRTGVRSIEAYNRFMAKNPSGKGKPPVDETPEISETETDHPEAGAELSPSAADGAGAAKRPDPDQPYPAKLPYIVIVIDELADLMMVAQRNVEESLARIAQMARAAGIHMILATQRPSVDVITGVIKANFPTRISFQVSSKVDSRTILDQLGAEKLLGAGDMLFIPPGASKLTRIHGAYVTEKEIDRIAGFLKKQGKPAYDKSIEEYEPEAADGEKGTGDYDEKYDEAVELVTDLGQASISLVQRYMKIGYNRAARIIEKMEAEGVVGPSDGVKPRKVLARKIPR